MGSLPDTRSMPTPVPELISIATRAPRKTSASPSRRRLRLRRNPTARSISHAQTGAAVLPATIPTVSGPALPRERTTSSAPRAMPGTHHGPNRSRQASASPVGGQMGVTTAPSAVSCCDSPSRPAA